MAISLKEVREIAVIARLRLTDEEVTSFTDDLNSILAHADTIRELDLADVPPAEHPLDVVNATRADEVRPGLSREAALANAPQAAEGAFVIPRIVGGGDES
ncbi:MAG: Asp-tRNA(Asn)/Glu-tRNA(Gln) amidotransferase subunit GatC [Coriobacteriia bacterium]|jgi:aspartyl-tRNA(Asn)/glutamyl-tRNA(Gln) amidotransferase subunit C|nr:Asp-tRNA(Asn)/Glu-tRNA(Gln) amidotransferase subunit GatC [Coriobacteriia bacterium]